MTGLAEKISTSVDVLRKLLERHAPERIVTAWTGGKDSTVVLHLWQGVLREWDETAPLRALSVDSGVKFPEVLAFRDDLALTWDVELTIARPGEAARSLPIAADVAACCGARKVEPLKRAIRVTGAQVVLTGLRRDEHPSRRDRTQCEVRPDLGCDMVHPLFEWTEMDVWAYHMRVGLPHCTLYDEGYRSLGCVPCTEKGEGGERSGRDQRKEAQLSALRSMGYF